MRDFITVATEIIAAIEKTGEYGAKKREFMSQLRRFIKVNKYYPVEATHPWNELGHIIRE